MKKEWLEKQEEFKQAILSIKNWEEQILGKRENESYKDDLKKYKNGTLLTKPRPYWYAFRLGHRKAINDLGLARGFIFNTDEQKDEFIDWLKGDHKAPYIWFLTKEMWDYYKDVSDWEEYYETRLIKKDYEESISKINNDIDDGRLVLNDISFSKSKKKWWEFWK